MEVIKLIGVLIVIVGFILKLDTLAVVVVAGLATGLVAGMSPMKILETLGTAFITNRTALFSFSHCRSSESVNGTV